MTNMAACHWGLIKMLSLYFIGTFMLSILNTIFYTTYFFYIYISHASVTMKVNNIHGYFQYSQLSHHHVCIFAVLSAQPHSTQPRGSSFRFYQRTKSQPVWPIFTQQYFAFLSYKSTLSNWLDISCSQQSSSHPTEADWIQIWVLMKPFLC